jgi:hypothetical protein
LKWSTVCSTFSRSGWSVVRCASLAKGGTSKKRPSPHVHKVPTRSNKVSPRTFQKALVFTCRNLWDRCQDVVSAVLLLHSQGVFDYFLLETRLQSGIFPSSHKQSNSTRVI